MEVTGHGVWRAEGRGATRGAAAVVGVAALLLLSAGGARADICYDDTGQPYECDPPTTTSQPAPPTTQPPPPTTAPPTTAPPTTSPPSTTPTPATSPPRVGSTAPPPAAAAPTTTAPEPTTTTAVVAGIVVETTTTMTPPVREIRVGAASEPLPEDYSGSSGTTTVLTIVIGGALLAGMGYVLYLLTWGRA